MSYQNLVDQWRAIVAQPLPKEAKQAECMTVFRRFVNSIAWKRIRGANRPLRFYADMVVLQQLLRPTFATDELGEVAIRPAYRLVSDWLDENNVARLLSSVAADTKGYLATPRNPVAST
jgi:hypothetical protein